MGLALLTNKKTVEKLILIEESELKKKIREIIKFEKNRKEESWRALGNKWSKNHQIGYIKAFEAMLEDL